jgi:hypothetical protein
MEQTNQFPKPQKPLKNYFKMTLDELLELDQDTQRALALKAMTNQYWLLERIKNNVVFFFWLTIISIIVYIIILAETGIL